MQFGHKKLLSLASTGAILFAGTVANAQVYQKVGSEKELRKLLQDSASTPVQSPTAKLKSAKVTISPRGYAQIEALYDLNLLKGENKITLDRLPTQIVTSSIDTDRFT